MKVLFEDKNIIVAVKPYGVLSTADAKDNMVTALSEISGGEIFPVHRLDKTTAGVMVYAKNKRSAAFLSNSIRNGEFKKNYLCLISGIMPQSEGRLEDLLFFDRKSNKSYVVKRERKGVKKAVLYYKTVEIKDNISLLEITLETGRTHQIRIQLADRGYPILGDRRYGSSFDFHQMALFSHRLEGISPTDKKSFVISYTPFGDAFEYFKNKKNA